MEEKIKIIPTKKKEFFINSKIIKNFKKNPAKGGKPAMEKNINISEKRKNLTVADSRAYSVLKM